MRFLTKLVLVSILLQALAACANNSVAADPKIMALTVSSSVIFDQPRDVKNFPLYIEALKVYAKENGINDQTIKLAFADVYHIEHVIKADNNQPEKKATIEQYLAKAVSPARIKLAKEKYLQYHSQLSQAALLTDVPQTYILALWGVESGYGKYQGNEDIISALATLSFDGRREAFFNKELIAALTILQQGHISKAKFKGSWAGAMGQNQFMPSSYLTYGLDGDGDGVIDIWNNMADIFASTGNYLSTVGWEPGQRWGNKIKLPNDFSLSGEGLQPEKMQTVEQWIATGITVIDNNSLPAPTTAAWVIVPDPDSGQGYLVYQNFKTLMHWNRSYYFAISVGMLADSLTESSLTASAE